MTKLLFLTIAPVMLAAAGATTSRAMSAPAPIAAVSRTVLASPADSADSLYRAGQAALSDRDYRRAAALFKQVVDKYPKSDRAGDSLYWRSYALYMAGNDARNKSDLDAALSGLQTYQRTYAQSGSMGGDAADLAGRIRAAQARLGDANATVAIVQDANHLRTEQSCAGSNTDEEMRMAAMDGLLSMSSEDAVPILKDVLKQRDACRIELRKKAVWLLSQKSATDVVPTLLDVARNDPSNDVRGQAVFWLSQTRSDLAVPALDSILFSNTADDDLRNKAMFALSQQRDDKASAALERVAGDEHMSDDLRSSAIFWLGQTRVTDFAYFKTLFHNTQNDAIRNKIIFSVSQSSMPEATTWLLDLAKDKTLDTETRKQAIFSAAQRKSVDLDQLEAIYTQAKGEDEIQKQVIFVLLAAQRAGGGRQAHDHCEERPEHRDAEVRALLARAEE